MFLRKMFGIKNQPRKGKNMKSQYSSGGLAALPVLPTQRNYLQFVHFTSKPTVSFCQCSQFGETFWSRPKVTPTLAG